MAPGEDRLASFPYKFLTDTGVMARLHDMQFLGVDYQAGGAQLTLRFIYDDPAYTPFEAQKTLVAVFRFADVEVQRWEDMADPGPDPNRIVAMLYVERHRFMQLVTGRTNLEFSTLRMQVTMEPEQ